MFQKIDPTEVNENAFSLIRDGWMLVTAGSAEHCNTMTASWGGFGVLWNRPVATCYLRPQRYTRTFVEREDFFTLAFFDESYREQLKLCGAKSGRDVDKIKQCGFTVATAGEGAPYFTEARLVLVCKKLYRQELTPQCFTDPTLDGSYYPDRDYHTMYIGEITQALQKIAN